MLTSNAVGPGRGWLGPLQSLRARAIALGMAALLLVSGGATYGAIDLYQADRLQVQGASLDEVHDDTVDLRLAMQEQQAALRGYAISGDQRFERDYEQGRADTAAAQRALGKAVNEVGLAGRYAQVVPTVAAWQSWAEAARQRIDAGKRVGPDSAATAVQGEQLFDAFTAQAKQLAEAARQVREQNELRVHQGLQSAALNALVSAALGLLLLAALLGLLLVLVLQPLRRLSGAAERLAAGRRARIPGVRRRDEVGVLARSLQEWVESEGTRQAIVDQSPAGIVVLSADGRFLRANASYYTLCRCTPQDIVTLQAGDLILPEDREYAMRLNRELVEGRRQSVEHMEVRHLRCDGSWFWSNMSIAPVQADDGLVTCYVAMVEDITERREQLTRAAGVQRGLLPRTAPTLDGYDLAGACRSAQEVGGDFFDWYRSRPDELTFSLGGVMGKGMPAAILMATARAALRTGARLGSIEESAQIVADALATDLEPLGAFVTLFHARLDEASGAVSFVDAGHGLAVIVHADGTADRLGGTDFPIGIVADHRYQASRATLAPGDALVVFSDGVLDVHPGLEESVEELGQLVTGAQSAGEMVDRLLSNSASAGDDVTVVALRREGVAAVRRQGAAESTVP